MSTQIITTYFSGMLLSLSLIVAIGAQNAFVLRQGLRREHIVAVCLVCAVSDAVLIAAGVAGFGGVIAHFQWLASAMRYGGAAFLLVYAIRAFVSAWRSNTGLSPLDGQTIDLKTTLLTLLGLTWLNPHVYLDTVILLGSISTQYHGHKILFAAGAMSGSVLFFFSLGFGAAFLRPLFASQTSWRVLDISVGSIMSVVACRLIL